jgi:hypothetical protein
MWFRWDITWDFSENKRGFNQAKVTVLGLPLGPSILVIDRILLSI